MAEYKKKDVKKIKVKKPSAIAENYKVTSFKDDFSEDAILMKSAKQAKKERKAKKKNAKYLRRQEPSKKIVYTKKSAGELNRKSGSPLKMIAGTKGEKIKRRVISLAVAVILIAGIVTLQVLSPTGIADLIRLKLVKSGSGGGFPVTVGGNTIENLYNLDGCLAAVSDTYIDVYNLNGKQILSAEHSIPNPSVALGYTRMLIFEQGGENLAIYDISDEKGRKTVKGTINSACIGRNGTYGVTYSTKSGAFKFTVYNPSNQKRFTYISDVGVLGAAAISNNGKYCALLQINAKDGKYLTNVRVFGSDNKPLYTKEFDSLIYSVEAIESNSFVLTTQNGVVVYNPANNTDSKAVTNIVKDGAIYMKSDCKSYGFGTVMGINGTGDKSELKIIKNSKELLFSNKIISSPDNVKFTDKYIAAAKDNFIYVYNYSGKHIATFNCGINAKKSAIIGESVFIVNNANIIEKPIGKEVE